jgi:transmembrane sensor
MDMDETSALAVQEQADRWFARLLAPDCSARERERFTQWKRVPEHAAAYAQRERLWERFAAPQLASDPRLLALRKRVLERTAEETTAEEMNAGNSGWEQALSTLPPRAKLLATSRKRRVWPLAIAACACLLAVLLGLRFMHSTPMETVYASTSALREIVLEDGTRVQLDLDTRLAARFDEGSRSVVLDHGRAVFDVAHDAQRPFTVELGESRVTVLGTRFQVLRSIEDVSVTLERGSLRLDGRNEAVPRSERLAPGEQIAYSPNAPSMWRKRSVDSTAAIAWSRGRLVFRATPLAEAVREVNRYARPKLRLADPAIADLQVSGNFIAGDSGLVASTWAATLPLSAEKQGDEIVLRPSRR